MWMVGWHHGFHVSCHHLRDRRIMPSTQPASSSIHSFIHSFSVSVCQLVSELVCQWINTFCIQFHWHFVRCMQQRQHALKVVLFCTLPFCWNSVFFPHNFVMSILEKCLSFDAKIKVYIDLRPAMQTLVALPNYSNESNEFSSGWSVCVCVCMWVFLDFLAILFLLISWFKALAHFSQTFPHFKWIVAIFFASRWQRVCLSDK